MNSHEFKTAVISSAEIEAALERARAERAKAMRAMLGAFYVSLKRFAGLLHLHHGHALPHAKAGA